MIDNHKLEIKAMECFSNGNTKEAHQLQNEFYAEVSNSGEGHCSGPSYKKRYM